MDKQCSAVHVVVRARVSGEQRKTGDKRFSHVCVGNGFDILIEAVQGVLIPYDMKIVSWEETVASVSFDRGRTSRQWLHERLANAAAAAILYLIEWIVRLNSGHGKGQLPVLTVRSMRGVVECERSKRSCAEGVAVSNAALDSPVERCGCRVRVA